MIPRMHSAQAKGIHWCRVSGYRGVPMTQVGTRCPGACEGVGSVGMVDLKATSAC